jgi:hypothetical protein
LTVGLEHSADNVVAWAPGGSRVVSRAAQQLAIVAVGMQLQTPGAALEAAGPAAWQPEGRRWARRQTSRALGELRSDWRATCSSVPGLGRRPAGRPCPAPLRQPRRIPINTVSTATTHVLYPGRLWSELRQRVMRQARPEPSGASLARVATRCRRARTGARTGRTNRD